MIKTHLEDIISGRGCRDTISTMLRYYTDTGEGVDYASNYHALDDLGLRSVWTSGGEAWELPERVNGYQLRRVIDALEFLEDNVILDDGIYCEMLNRLADEQLRDMANEEEIDPDLFISAFWDRVDGDTVYVYSENGTAAINLSKEDAKELIATAKEAGNTWETHYNSGVYHYPEHCYYCAQALIGIGA